VAREAGGAPSLDKAVFFLHLGRARESLRAGRLEEARQELELARLAHPDDGEVLNLVSIVEFRRGDFAEAARAARALLLTNPESAVLHANLGMIQFKAGALADAERELTRAIELDPGHARGHLYLGLLLRGRGELAGALKHLRRAGARKAADEVEEMIAAPARNPLLSAVPSPPARPVPARVESLEKSGPADRPLFEIAGDGSLRIASRGLVYVRKGAVVRYGGRIRFLQEPAFAGTKLENLLKAEGPGDLLLADLGKRCLAREPGAQSLYLDAAHLLAFSAGLRFRVQPIQDFGSRRRVDILKIQGRGEAVFSVAGAVEARDVSRDFPLSISSRDLVAWTGDLLPSVLEDRFLDEVMTPDPGDAPKLRFEGEGVVLTEGPRTKDW
jgi:tetratricopeptide (TPR) repeat protein